MNIRPETPADISAIRSINVEAFETKAEADLVDILRETGIPFVSLVAEAEDQLVGHILFTPVTLSGHESELTLFGLAPMAVLPEYQYKGIGSELIRAGIRECRDNGADAFVVLGHPEYYPKFGFQPSVQYGIRSEYEVPDEVFMTLELEEGILKDRSGIIRYHKAFGNV